MQLYQEKIGPVQLALLETDKFKSTRIVFKFRAPLDEKTVTKRALLAMLFETSNQTYPNQTDFRKKLAYLYGANFYTTVEKKGNEHIISAVFDMVDADLVPDGENLLAEAFAFIEQVFFNPLVKNQAFDEETVEREKTNLQSRLEGIYDDKARYANRRLQEEMFAEDVFRVPASGLVEEIRQIDATNLFTYYQEWLKTDAIDVYVCGRISRNTLIPYLEKLVFPNRKNQMAQFTTNTARKEAQYVYDVQPINQGKLAIGYQTNTLFGDADFVALQLGNGLLGGYANSKIFVNVREKESLAYSASSRVDSFKGYLLISAGIDEANYEKALAIILEQVAAMKAGDFTEEELAQTKEMYINQLLETTDQAQGMIEISYNNQLRASDLDPENWIRKIEQTTKEEVLAAIRKIELDTVYFLSRGVTEHA
ncbi:EF-P 5-aminopentanol modification-associated protein YfmF [Listeria costaricensis]|uniref:EF-P 5-aminopentanol modification-associated protein YfmF n=1 Tax=Listeria costaricensis TaxID=2026604 RepID=UPI003B845BF1